MLEVQIYKKLAEFDLDVSFQVNDNILGLWELQDPVKV